MLDKPYSTLLAVMHWCLWQHVFRNAQSACFPIKKCLFPHQKRLNPTAFRSSTNAPVLSNSIQIGKYWNVFVAELPRAYPHLCGAKHSILLGFAHDWRQRQLSPKSLNVWNKWAFLITYTSFKMKNLTNLPNQKIKSSAIVLQNTPCPPAHSSKNKAHFVGN